MKVLSEVEFVVITGNVFEDINQKWADSAVANAELANRRREEKIGTLNAYQDQIVAPSSRAYDN
ncbi:MAG: hypothetical protein QME16_08140, partial [Planctomycetota bacterium]|nr:hypothetical protein [Planctomycetota bacterium]